eukprot:TRINITY_DN1509_c0_g1_i2.p1 TRINITY_DN1509_c0_g1~~TRINITY_DN1509_c0_g1_i2.p1  ORF type:complete len:671 (+),score=196.82 TRINITY_DN1509_c0_g1_i2:148-2160(+)
MMAESESVVAVPTSEVVVEKKEVEGTVSPSSSTSNLVTAPAAVGVTSNANVALTSSGGAIPPLGLTSSGGTPINPGVAASPPLSPREQRRREAELKDIMIVDKITIISTRTQKSDLDGKLFTVYKIKIGEVEFEKRYSEFADFHDLLRAKHNYAFNGFPGKLTFNNMSEATISRRSQLLAQFLNDVNNSVKEFPERAALLDNFLMNANKLVIMRLATALLQSVFTYVPEVKAGIDAAVAIAKVASSFPVEKLSFMTDVIPVCLGVQQWADYVFGVAGNQLDKKQRKKVLEGTYLYNLAFHIGSMFENTEPGVEKLVPAALMKQLAPFLGRTEKSLFTIERFNQFRDNLVAIRDEIGKTIPEHAHEAKCFSKKLVEYYCKTISLLVPDVALQPPCAYAIISGGSFARREQTPFGGFDFLILVENKHKLHQNRAFFDRMLWLLQLGIINLGGSVKPVGSLNPFNHITSGRIIQKMIDTRFWLLDGFRYDTATVSPIVDPEEFITTPKRLVKLLTPDMEHGGGEPEVRNTLMFPQFVCGTKAIYENFINLKIADDRKRYPSSSVRFNEFLPQVRDITENFRLLRPEHNDFILDVNDDLYKPFNNIITTVARILLEPEDIYNHQTHCWKLIKKLKCKETRVDLKIPCSSSSSHKQNSTRLFDRRHFQAFEEHSG